MTIFKRLFTISALLGFIFAGAACSSNSKTEESGIESTQSMEAPAESDYSAMDGSEGLDQPSIDDSIESSEDDDVSLGASSSGLGK